MVESTKLGILPLFWLFVIGSVAGLAIETVYHAIVFGGYEDRAGLVWGPFSPIYGTGAVVLTIATSRLAHANPAAVFVVSAFVGSTVEFATSWLMETLFGAIAWDYSGTFCNIDGRVNLAFALMWGTLGLVWARIALPLMERSAQRVDWRSTAVRIVSIAGALFMAFNIVVTVQALARESARLDHIPAATPIDHFLDRQFPSTWMQNRFENMSIYGSSLRDL